MSLDILGKILGILERLLDGKIGEEDISSENDRLRL